MTLFVWFICEDCGMINNHHTWECKYPVYIPDNEDEEDTNLERLDNAS